MNDDITNKPALPYDLPKIPESPALLEGQEVILLVDDYPDIVVLLQDFLKEQGFPSVTAASAAELRTALQNYPVALILLDIGLPDADGRELLPELKKQDADMAVIMLTAVTDLQTALDCLRQGADDYLTKPVKFAKLIEMVRQVLERRRLRINNRRYQRQIEQANFRLRLLHELTLKMNTAYLSMVELDEILQAILVGITAEEGLQFNRAFLALFDDRGEYLEGRFAIGPDCKEEAGRIWLEMKQQHLTFEEILRNIKGHCFTHDSEINRIVQALRVPASNHDNILIRATRERRSINVVDGHSDCPVEPELLGLLEEETFVVVPLYSPGKSLGVIIADHFVTRKPIRADLIRALEGFASQASLAIEHCRLYMAMENKIAELVTVTKELAENKDLLVESERYSALGHMAAQLVHAIRNPITSIGGTARLLSRKTEDPELLRFLNMMTREATRVESTLQDLFSFVSDVSPKKEKVELYPILHKSLALYYPTMQKQHIEWNLSLAEPSPVLLLDERQMQKVFVHVIRNAVEAMQEGGTLTVESRFEDSSVVLVFKDTGVGIASPNLTRATDPFFTTKTYGTGMGLALVRSIIAEHGGDLQIESGLESGTKIRILLPFSNTKEV